MIDDKTMRNLQDLSRLRLGPEEEAKLAGQLDDILDYFEMLSRYDTSGVDADLGTAVLPGDLRKDEAGTSVGREKIESFAVEFDEDHFVVPRILGDGSDG